MKIGKAVQKDMLIFRQSSRWKAVIDAVQELSPELALPVTLDKKEEAIALQAWLHSKATPQLKYQASRKGNIVYVSRVIGAKS